MKRTMTPGEFRRLPVYETGEAPLGVDYLNPMMAAQLASKLDHGQMVMFMKNHKDGDQLTIQLQTATIYREEKINASY